MHLKEEEKSRNMTQCSGFSFCVVRFIIVLAPQAMFCRCGAAFKTETKACLGGGGGWGESRKSFNDLTFAFTLILAGCSFTRLVRYQFGIC